MLLENTLVFPEITLILLPSLLIVTPFHLTSDMILLCTGITFFSLLLITETFLEKYLPKELFELNIFTTPNESISAFTSD